ncbi:MAG: CRISPR-associated helicase Cas3' [Verrucomicrobia bacterium]|nr:CRISPR-associated helicase Cas3' [Verrucomicrobiota bacterium]MCH8528948.1 CRISPR-associated helicase Cas3' [Kiritimatiellia bacterium]
MKTYFAHTLKNHPKESWEVLETHLREVSELAGEFSEAFGAAEWAKLAGVWHDLGKYSDEFQYYLTAQNDMHIQEVAGKVDHTTAGAQFAVKKMGVPGHLLAYLISGHHTGLMDMFSEHACLDARLKKEVYPTPGAPETLLTSTIPSPPSILMRAHQTKECGFAVSFFTRMLFSCLVDADFLATEQFMNPGQAASRPKTESDILKRMLEALDKKLEDFENPKTQVEQERAHVLEACKTKSSEPHGLFSLTVPTGGGKTLSSLAFALRHALHNGMSRIIYVIPFTSIIEQNAQVFKDIFAQLGSDLVLEHHSNTQPKEETERSRLAAENWDAPLIVTTSAQFYESLFANRTSKTRKLHNIANAVIILDEAQTLPVDYIAPCLAALRELTQRYHSTVVLCTATQPSIRKTEDFPIGLEDIREIIDNPIRLYHQLQRTKTEYVGMVSDQTLADKLTSEKQVLCVVNSRKHAQTLFQKLGSDSAHFHLSALMCPAHRSKKLDKVRERLNETKPVRLISTQLIEAGVDVDFPVVYRSMAGLDSIAQAAGRCNRNGKNPDLGNVLVFDSEHQASEKYFRETANIAKQVLDMEPDPLGLSAVERYFNIYLWQQRSRWDQKDILGLFNLGQTKDAPYLFNFRKAAERFKLIESGQITVFIPYGDESKPLFKDLRNSAVPLHRALCRSLQRYAVNIYPNHFYANERDFEMVREEFPVLLCPEQHYSEDCGLTLPNESTPNPTLII